MTMRGILVHVDEHRALHSVLTCALLAARRFDSQIDGLHARPGAPRIIPVAPEGAFIPASEIVEDLERADRDLDRQLRERFDAFMREHGVPAVASVLPGAEVAAAWRDEAVAGYEALGSTGRAYDLIAVARPLPGAAVPSMNALEAALFESGRPVLIAPPTPPGKLGDIVVVAWNGSTETARTIALAMPFLAKAETVVVLSVEEGMVPGPTRWRNRAWSDAQRHRGQNAADPGWRPCGRRRDPRPMQGARRRPAAQGCLYAQPPAPNDLRRRHESHSGRGRAAGDHGALNRPVSHGAGKGALLRPVSQ